jgi:acrR protein
MHQSETDMIERIFTATNDLMATVGLPNLSIHKIAKEAKISPGTIYLYFKNKDELLEQFARYIFKSFEETLKKTMMKTSRFSNAIGKCGGIFGILWNKIQRELPIWDNMNFYPGFILFAKNGKRAVFGIVFVKKQ